MTSKVPAFLYCLDGILIQFVEYRHLNVIALLGQNRSDDDHGLDLYVDQCRRGHLVSDSINKHSGVGRRTPAIRIDKDFALNQLAVQIMPRVLNDACLGVDSLPKPKGIPETIASASTIPSVYPFPLSMVPKDGFGSSREAIAALPPTLISLLLSAESLLVVTVRALHSPTTTTLS